MEALVWHKVAAVSGISFSSNHHLLVDLDQYATGNSGCWIGSIRCPCGFKPQNPSYKEVWQTASLYHLVHTAALVAAPITKYPHVFGGLLTAGIIAFSGACYTVALLEDRKYSSPAPFGGIAFIAAWASLLL